MLPRPLITRFAFRQVAAELDRVAPNEGILVPLMCLGLRDPAHNPCATIELAELADVIIAAVVLVPQDHQVNQGTRVSVRPATDAVVNAKVEALVRRFPRLRACAYLHSHPFARGRTWPSSGTRCDYEGHMLPQLASNTAAGLRAAFSFIACRSEDGRGWRLHCFAVDAAKRVIDLGLTEVVADGHQAATTAFTPAVKSRAAVRSILRHWLVEARRRRLATTSDELFDGWQRLVVHLDSVRTLVGLVPIDFPARPPRYYLVDRASGRTTRYRPVDNSTAMPAVVDSLRRATTSSSHGVVGRGGPQGGEGSLWETPPRTAAADDLAGGTHDAPR